jgi:hypothetical protein
MSSSPTAQSHDNASLRWITATKPGDFKTKSNMQAVRQTAMGSYLKSTKNQAGEKVRANSEASDHSRSSFASQGAPKPPPPKTPKGKGRKDSEVAQTLPKAPLQPASDIEETPRRETQIIRSKHYQSTLPQTPIVVPIDTGRVYPFDKHPMPQLVSLGPSLDPFRTMFQSSNPRVSVEKLKHKCSRYFGTEGLGRYWIPECLNYPHTFLSTLYMASAYDDVVHNRELETLETAALRQDVIHLVSRNLTDPEKSMSDHNIIAVSQLILGEVINRTEASLRFHQDGIETMIRQRHGLGNLGVNGQLASAVSWANLATAVLQETTPTPMYVEYCKWRAIKTYPINATIPESPLYQPHGKYVTIEKSTNCNANARKLLNDIRTMAEDFLVTGSPRRTGISTKLRNIYERIIRYPSVHQPHRTAALDKNDWKYEAIRLAAIIQAQAIFDQVPLSEAIDNVQSPEIQSVMYCSSTASQSNDSFSSTFDGQDITPATDFESPTISSNSGSHAKQHNGFPFNHWYSNSFTYSQRPLLSSWQSSSSDIDHRQQTSAQTGSGSIILRNLRDTLENSDLSDCWSDMAGVLLWIGLVTGAASNKTKDKILRRYFSATTMRTCIMLCFEHPEAIHSTMLKMTDIVAALGQTSNEGQLVRNDSFVSRKRLKV